MTRVRFIISSAAVLATTGGLVACGGSGAHDRIVVRVGGSPITMVAFTHWMQAMAPQHVAPDPPRYVACITHRKALERQSAEVELLTACRQQFQRLKRQVLDFLISSQWLIGEAADQGMRVSDEEVKRRLDEKQRSLASGDAEFKASLKAIGHTIADLELEIQAELASERIRRKLIDDQAKVTPREVATYYRKNIRRFRIPERRFFDIAENLKSAAAARKLVREIKAGRSLAGTSLHESLPRKSFSDFNGEKRTIYEAIFTAKPHMLAPPVRLGHFYFLIEVTRITPPILQSLRQVQRSIEKKLSVARQRRTLAAFVKAWRSRWIARTDCDAEYVVQKCGQYGGPRTPEDALALN